MADVQYSAFPQWVHAGASFENDGVGHYSPAYYGFFPRSCPSPTDQIFRLSFGTSPYSLQGNNFIPAWMGYSERRIRRGTGAFIPTYNQYQVMDRHYPIQGDTFFWWNHNRLAIDGFERRGRGTGVFHPRLVSKSLNSDTTAKNTSSEGLGQNRDTDKEDAARKYIAKEPEDYPKAVLQELGLPEEWTY